MKQRATFSILSVLLCLMALTDVAQAYYNPSTGRFLSRDPIAERGGANIYAFVKNNAVSYVDYLGLQVQPSSPKKKKCLVLVEIDHVGDHDINDPKDVPPNCRFGAIGCLSGTDELNNSLNNAGVGIPGIPQTGGDLVGPGSRAKPGTAPNDDGYNGQYPKGSAGFVQLLQAAWDAAIAEGGNVSEESKDKKPCCKKVDVRMKAGSADATRILKKHGLNHWGSKHKVVRCK